jgi:membrane protein DedA with SNARE-associated domain
MTFDSTLTDAIGAYGAWIVGGAVAVESMGIPVPGETMLITAAVFAGTTGQLNVADVVLAAIFGAIAGDNAGFLIGRTVGFRWLVRHRSRLRLTTRRLKLGQYLFLRHGGKVVFFGRFIALLRTYAALLAGANNMPWPKFFLFNATGGVVWACIFGIGGYLFGSLIERYAGPVGIILLVGAVLAGIVGIVLSRRHEHMLIERAERALPGPLKD